MTIFNPDTRKYLANGK